MRKPLVPGAKPPGPKPTASAVKPPPTKPARPPSVAQKPVPVLGESIMSDPVTNAPAAPDPQPSAPNETPVATVAEVMSGGKPPDPVPSQASLPTPSVLTPLVFEEARVPEPPPIPPDAEISPSNPLETAVQASEAAISSAIASAEAAVQAAEARMQEQAAAAQASGAALIADRLCRSIVDGLSVSRNDIVTR